MRARRRARRRVGARAALQHLDRRTVSPFVGGDDGDVGAERRRRRSTVCPAGFRSAGVRALIRMMSMMTLGRARAVMRLFRFRRRRRLARL